MITVAVYRSSDNKPVKGARVSIHFGGEWTGTYTDSVYTNSDGIAEFDIDEDRTGKIYVNGDEIYSGFISGSESLYI